MLGRGCGTWVGEGWRTEVVGGVLNVMSPYCIRIHRGGTCLQFACMGMGLQTRTEPGIRGKVLDLIQVWTNANVFKNDVNYRTALQETYGSLKGEGFSFPPISPDTLSDAIFAAERAPDWKDATTCQRCTVAFSLLNRKVQCILLFFSFL